MSNRPFQYEFDFDTIVETPTAPTAKSIRLRLHKLDGEMIVVSTQHDCEHFPDVWVTKVFFSISEEGKPRVQVVVTKPEEMVSESWNRVVNLEVNDDGSVTHKS